ncbi:MAG: carboxylating nicotinate-nucleotide diphosphorylase [Acidimicrobiia bacterium]
MSSFDPPLPAVRALVALALVEDHGLLGDITSIACIEEGQKAEGAFIAREPGVLAGTAAAAEVFRQIDPSVVLEWDVGDGAAVDAGATLGRMRGSMRSILLAERVALNLLSHSSGVATATRRCVNAVGGEVRIRDTRKTLPGLRALQRAAVRAGGGFNHRDSLSDAVLIKDNHLVGIDLAEAVARARAAWPGRTVEVECDTLEQVAVARDAGADIVMLDNMAPDAVRRAVELLAGACRVEVSGGVTLDSLPAYARSGPDFISIGALTHSAPALDIGLDLA